MDFKEQERAYDVNQKDVLIGDEVVVIMAPPPYTSMEKGKVIGFTKTKIRVETSHNEFLYKPNYIFSLDKVA